MPVYLDCNATTPIEPEVAQVVRHYMEVEFGNAGSRTHEFGQRAAEAIALARQQVGDVVDARPEELIFTSGATESLNIAILGLAAHGEATGRRHIISTAIEHKAVLEPLAELMRRGFEVTLVNPSQEGFVDPDAISAALRPDTLLVSVMQVNNETGIMQPIAEIANALSAHEAYFLVDAAQGYGKVLPPLRNKRIDLIAISGHKIYGPKGIGALIARGRAGYKKVPLRPLMHGGGQERGLRPGTLPVPLIAGLGKAAEQALSQSENRAEACQTFRDQLLKAISAVPHTVIGDQSRGVPHTLAVAIAGLNSEAAMLALRDLVSISNGSACTSTSYTPSHVLTAMGLDGRLARQVLRFSWSHLTPDADWSALGAALTKLGRVA